MFTQINRHYSVYLGLFTTKYGSLHFLYTSPAGFNKYFLIISKNT